MPLFNSLLGEPTDPVYIAFRDGVMKANNDVTDAWRWRWSPKFKGWFTYSVDRWILDDVGVVDTPAGSSFHLINNADPNVEEARTTMFLPPVFRAVEGAYQQHQTRWPNLVWTWLGGGDWRNAMDRADPHQGHPTPDKTPPTDDPIDRLTPECKQRIADVRAFAARGDITTAQSQRLIARIVEECTVSPR
jgi:hypothetical protein